MSMGCKHNVDDLFQILAAYDFHPLQTYTC